jgi:hypothetical protein
MKGLLGTSSQVTFDDVPLKSLHEISFIEIYQYHGHDHEPPFCHRPGLPTFALHHFREDVRPPRSTPSPSREGYHAIEVCLGVDNTL